MKLLKPVSPDNTGGALITLQVSNLEDLYQLYNFVATDDIVKTITSRKVTIESKTGSTTEKKTLKLAVLVEKIAFDPMGELRLQGPVQNENKWVMLNVQHTLSVRTDVPQEVEVRKADWDELCQERLEAACDDESRIDTAVIMMNYGQAILYLVTPSVVVPKNRVELSIAKKHKLNGSSRDDSIQKFFRMTYEAVASTLNFDAVKVVVVCSEGTIRNEFLSLVRRECAADRLERDALVRRNLGKFISAPVSAASKGSVREALMNPDVLRRMDNTKSADGLAKWEEFMRIITMDPDRCVYSPQIVTAALHEEAIGTLFVCDELFRSTIVAHRQFFRALLVAAREKGATVFTLSSETPSGAQLRGMGGVAAILSFALPQLEEIEPDPHFLSSPAAMALLRDEQKTMQQLREESTSSS